MKKQTADIITKMGVIAAILVGAYFAYRYISKKIAERKALENEADANTDTQAAQPAQRRRRMRVLAAPVDWVDSPTDVVHNHPATAATAPAKFDLAKFNADISKLKAKDKAQINEVFGRALMMFPAPKFNQADFDKDIAKLKPKDQEQIKDVFARASMMFPTK